MGERNAEIERVERELAALRERGQDLKRYEQRLLIQYAVGRALAARGFTRNCRA